MPKEKNHIDNESANGTPNNKVKFEFYGEEMLATARRCSLQREDARKRRQNEWTQWQGVSPSGLDGAQGQDNQG